MKYLRQFGIIMAVTCIGEFLRYWLPLPIPASIYGLVLMVTLLATGVVKMESVKDAGKFMVEIMPLMFIPAAVGLIVTWGELKRILVPVLIITVVSTIVVMVVTGKVTDFVLKEGKGKNE